MEIEDKVERIQLAMRTVMQNIESDSAACTSLKLTKAQMFLLFHIRNERKCRLSQLADKLEVKPSAITVMIDRLEKVGYVKRMHDVIDRRVILVEMTSLGHDVLEEAFRIRNKVLADYLSQFEQEEVASLLALLEKLAKIAKE